jgi:hypothetical protein
MTISIPPITTFLSCLEPGGPVVVSLPVSLTPAPSALAEPTWLSTSEAARALGVDRGHLDRRAEAASQAMPAAVVRIGEGKARQTYRWRSDSLGEAMAVKVEAKPEAPKRRKPRKASAAKRGTGSKLRAIVG